MSKNLFIEQCSICLENFANQEIGIPEHCDHSFCFDCLIDWAKTNNSCPIDRQIFQHILKKQSLFSSKPYLKVNIHNQSETYLEDHLISCYACGSDDQEYPILTCERCTDSYHTFCLNSSDTSAWVCLSCGYDHDKTKKVVKTPVIVEQLRTRIGTSNHGRPYDRVQQHVFRNGPRRIRSANPIIRNSPQISALPLLSTIQTSNQLIDNNNNIRLKNKPSTRSVITPSEAARRIAVSGIPVITRPQTAPLMNQVQKMTVDRKRTRVRRLLSALPRISINQLPRIQRRADAPPRPQPKPKTQKSNSTSASFIDNLLNAQKCLCSLQNIRMQGAHIQIS